MKARKSPPPPPPSTPLPERVSVKKQKQKKTAPSQIALNDEGDADDQFIGMFCRQPEQPECGQSKFFPRPWLGLARPLGVL